MRAVLPWVVSALLDVYQLVCTNLDMSLISPKDALLSLG